MARGKGRHTARTGDRSLYKNRATSGRDRPGTESTDAGGGDFDDRVHRHAEQALLRLDDAGGGGGSDDDDDDTIPEEAVMDLGLRGEEEDDDDDRSSSDGSSSDDDELDDGRRQKQSKRPDEDDDDDEADDQEDAAISSSDDDDDEDDDDDAEDDVRDWGRRKAAYYHGDTADLEIGQDREDAFLEEEAAREVQAARYRDMAEDDFLDADTEAATGKTIVATDTVTLDRDRSRLSAKEKRRYLDKQHPEMLPLLSYFEAVVHDLSRGTGVAAQALLDGEEGAAETVGATRAGQQYLLTKYLVQLSTALNLCLYLLLKAEHARQHETVDPQLIQTHPVMARLQKLNSLVRRLETGVEDRVDGLREQLTKLVQAAKLMKSGEISDESSDEEDSVGNATGNELDGSEDEPVKSGAEQSDDEDGASGDEDSDDDDANRHVLSEARFGIRLSEVKEDLAERPDRRRRPAPSASFGEFNDEAEVNPKSLAPTLNTIEQRMSSKKRKAAPAAADEQIDELERDNDQLRRGLEMMEAELGKDFDKDEKGDDASDDMDPELDDDDFYSKVAKASKSRKEQRKQLYAVAPKFPSVEAEVEGERGISRQILKNRGLVAHKKKLNRNPRVKKREQYRKALIRRKGAVREVRTDEGHKYAGEGTGIKSTVSRSRKLAS